MNINQLSELISSPALLLQLAFMAVASGGLLGLLIFRDRRRPRSAPLVASSRQQISPKRSKERERKAQREAQQIKTLIERREWAEVIGTTKRRYYTRAAVVGLIVAALVFAISQSVALTLFAFGGAVLVARFRAQRRFNAFRELISSEVLPAAEAIANDLDHNRTLIDSLRRVAAEGPGRGAITSRHRGNAAAVSPIAQLFRRVVSAQTTIEQGLEEELDTASNELLVEFLHTLIFASSNRLGATPRAISAQMKEFRSTYVKEGRLREMGLAKAGTARGTRAIMLAVIPASVALSLLTGGPATVELMLHSLLGNMIIITIGVLMLIAYLITERIMSVVK